MCLSELQVVDTKSCTQTEDRQIIAKPLIAITAEQRHSQMLSVKTAEQITNTARPRENKERSSPPAVLFGFDVNIMSARLIAFFVS